MSSAGSDMMGTGSCSSSASSSCSVDNICTTPTPLDNFSLLTFFAYPKRHQFLHSSNHSSRNMNEFTMDRDYSPPPPPPHPSYCSCHNGDRSYLGPEGMSVSPSPNTSPIDLNRLIDETEALHWKYHHHHQAFGVQNLIREEESRKCSCHLQHPSHPHSQNSHLISSRNNYARLLSRTGDGRLLRSLEKGVLFPVIHWSSKSNENLTHPLHPHLYPTLHFNQGIYKELKRVIPPDVWLQQEADTFIGLDSSLRGSINSLSSVSSRKSTTWLIIGYKSLEKTLDSTLEATWKEWTGTRHVYLHLRSDFEIRRISFLHRAHPVDNLDLFMYVVLMEIGNVDEGNRIWLLDFVQRMRVERMKGFLTVYSEVEQDVSSIGDEYLKYKNKSQIQPSPPPRSHFHLTQPKTAPPSLLRDKTASLLDLQSTEINGNIKFMEKLLEEIHQQPIGDYF